MLLLKRGLLAFCFVFLVLPGTLTAQEAEKAEWPVTAVHRSLAHEKEWLNTSAALTVDDLKGRILVLNFWTNSCIACIHGLADLKNLEATYKNKIAVIGIHSGKFDNERDIGNIKDALIRHQVEHPTVNDKNFYIWKKMAVKAWPTLVLVNPQGRIEEIYTGEGNLNKIKKSIDGMLKSYDGLANNASLPIALEKEKKPQQILNFPGKIIYVPDYKKQPVFFISDSGNNRIIGTTVLGRIFITIGSGKLGKDNGDFAKASFNNPQGMVYKDNTLYIADAGNHILRKASLESRKVETVAGTGDLATNRNVKNLEATKTRLSSPWDLAFYPDNKHIAIAMAGSHQIWSYDIENKTLNIIAGNGNEAIKNGAYPYNSLARPSALAADGDRLYFTDSGSSSLRFSENSQISTLIGKGLFDFGYEEGNTERAMLQYPSGISVQGQNIYIADSFNNSIRRYSLEDKLLHNFLGNGKKGDAIGTDKKPRFNEPGGLTATSNKLYIADTNNNSIKVWDIDKKALSVFNIIPDDSLTEDRDVYREELPNMKYLPFEKVSADKSIKLYLIMNKGFKLNPTAVSRLSIYQVNGQDFELIKSYRTRDFSNNMVVLPDLKNNKAYKLQGTLYYCEDKEGEKCYLANVDKTIKSDAATNKTRIDIKL